MKVNMVWAKQSDGTKIHIQNNSVVRHNNKGSDGNYKYKCFCHDFPVLAIKGDINGQHFRHDNESLDDINLYRKNLKGHNETIIHKLGKKIFSELLHLELPNNFIKEEEDFYLNYPFKKDIENNEFRINFPEIVKSYIFELFPDESKIEKSLKSISVIPDVQVMIFNSNLLAQKTPLVVEVFVSHFLTDEKINKYKSIELSCIQVDLSKFLTNENQSNDIDFEPLIKKYITRKEIYDYPNFLLFNRLNSIKEIFDKVYNEKLLEHNRKLLPKKTELLRYSFVDSKPIVININKADISYCCPICNDKLEISNNSFIHPLNYCKIFFLDKISTQKLLISNLYDYIKNILKRYSSWSVQSFNFLDKKNQLEINVYNEKYNITFSVSTDLIYKYLESSEGLFKIFEATIKQYELEIDTKKQSQSLVLKEHYLALEKFLIFAVDEYSSIITIDSATPEKSYNCLCCNKPIILKYYTKNFTHNNENYDCAIFKNQNAFKHENAFDLTIPKVLELNNMKLFNKEFNNRIYLVKLKYVKMCQNNREIEIQFQFSHSHLWGVETYSSSCFVLLKHLNNQLNETDNFDFIESVWYNVENTLNLSVLTKDKINNEKLRISKVSKFFNKEINNNNCFCPLCCGRIQDKKHLNQASDCPILKLEDSDFNEYYNKFSLIKNLYDFLMKIKNKQYRIISWAKFFDSHNINVSNLKFIILQVDYYSEMKYRKENIEFLIEINNKRFCCGIGLTQKNKFNKDLYFKLNYFDKRDLTSPIDASINILNFLKSL